MKKFCLRTAASVPAGGSSLPYRSWTCKDINLVSVFSQGAGFTLSLLAISPPLSLTTSCVKLEGQDEFSFLASGCF